MSTLNDAEWALVDRLVEQIVRKKRRNELRTAYMDGKHVLSKLPPSSPPYLRQLRVVVGWPAKAVEELDRYIRLDGFNYGGDDLFGIDELLRANDYFSATAQAQLSALVHSTVFQTVTAGGPGEPDAVVSQVSAMNGTGEWDQRRREFKNFLAVRRWPDATVNEAGFRSSGEFTLFLDHEVVWVVDGQVESRVVSNVRMPVTHMPYKPRLDRPFGSSRISRSVMSLTDLAVRTLIRSEGTADLYGVPWFMIFGPDESAFQKGGWQMIMDRINAIPDNEDAANPRADVKQFSQGSQQPHVEQLKTLASLFAGETKIPVSSLGVGMTQANPTSAASYDASLWALIAEAEDAQSNWTEPHAKIARWVWQVANKDSEIPDELARVTPKWRNTKPTSQAEVADAIVKLVSALPWMANSPTVIETLGFDKETTARLLEEQRRAAGIDVFAGLMQGDDDGGRASVGGEA